MLFPKLPAEVRIKIWEFAANQPRIIAIDWCSDYFVKRKVPLPVLFQVSYEAREIAEKVYKIEKDTPGFQGLRNTDCSCLINYEVDIFLMTTDWWHDFRYIKPHLGTHLIHRIAMTPTVWYRFTHLKKKGKLRGWKKDLWGNSGRDRYPGRPR